MVGQRSPSLYELLEVSSSATFEEIEQSYHRIAAYLGEGSLAVYSILDRDDARSARTQLDEAFRTLSDPDRRAAYDRARREDATYPPLIVPVNAGDSTSTVGEMVDEPSVRSHGEEEYDRGLPVHGRTQDRPPIRGSGVRTGRTPRYGRDVGAPARTADTAPMRPAEAQLSSASHEPTGAESGSEGLGMESKRRPRYGRAQPKSQVAAQPPRPSGRWSVRLEELEPPPRGSGLVAAEDVDAGAGRTPVAPEVPAQAVALEAPPRPQTPTILVESNRTELVKTVSEVLEPRRRSTVPPPAQLAASAKSKRRLPSPSVVLELSGDVEFGGALLRRLRESTGATLDEVAEITKVSKRYLIAMETNDFAALPAAVYTRGFVAEYARVLGLDVTRVTKSFMALYVKYRGVGG